MPPNVAVPRVLTLVFKQRGPFCSNERPTLDKERPVVKAFANPKGLDCAAAKYSVLSAGGGPTVHAARSAAIATKLSLFILSVSSIFRELINHKWRIYGSREAMIWQDQGWTSRVPGDREFPFQKAQCIANRRPKCAFARIAMVDNYAPISTR
jgi:hypothetical protein